MQKHWDATPHDIGVSRRPRRGRPTGRRAGKMDLYGRFLGSWDLDVRQYSEDGSGAAPANGIWLGAEGARCRLRFNLRPAASYVRAAHPGTDPHRRSRHRDAARRRKRDLSHRSAPCPLLASSHASERRRARGRQRMRNRTMTGADKVVCQAATLLLLFTLTSTPAKAQFAGGGGGGQDMMTQMAPMLEMMKAKMGKRRFGTMMQTMGPMMSRMTENGGRRWRIRRHDGRRRNPRGELRHGPAAMACPIGGGVTGRSHER